MSVYMQTRLSTDTHTCTHILQETLNFLLFPLMYTSHFSLSRKEVFFHQSTSLKLALRL